MGSSRLTYLGAALNPGRRTTLALLAAATLACAREGPEPSAVLITLDTTRADALGVYGGEGARTVVTASSKAASRGGSCPSSDGAELLQRRSNPRTSAAIPRRVGSSADETEKRVMSRANPVLFDRVTFSALMKLKGDIGGRGIFSEFSPKYIHWNDSGLLLDVDTPDDHERLLSR